MTENKSKGTVKEIVTHRDPCLENFNPKKHEITVSTWNAQNLKIEGAVNLLS